VLRVTPHLFDVRYMRIFKFSALLLKRLDREASTRGSRL
jgi:hypothetical protein